MHSKYSIPFGFSKKIQTLSDPLARATSPKGRGKSFFDSLRGADAPPFIVCDFIYALRMCYEIGS